MKKSRSVLITLTAAGVLGATACAADREPTAPEGTSQANESASPAPSSDGQPSPSEDGGLSTVLAAIDAAVAETGGTAYEIEENDDDGIWEIDVAKGVRSVEVEVKPNRDVTERGETDLHAEAREGLNHAKIDLGPAVETAMSEVDGTFAEADLVEIDGQHYWKVTVDPAAAGEADDDREVLVEVTDGTVTVGK